MWVVFVSGTGFTIGNARQPTILFWNENLYLYENSNSVCNNVSGPPGWLRGNAQTHGRRKDNDQMVLTADQ